MSKKLFFLPALLLGAFLMFSPACGDSDPCKDVVCENADCFEGDCVCRVGFEKDANGNCVTPAIDKIAGAYSVVEDCSLSDPDAYLAAIVAVSGDTKKATITNFWNLFKKPVNVTIDGQTKLIIARQDPDGDKFYVEGSGVISTNAAGKTVITFTYTVKDETGPTVITDACNSTVYTKN